MQNGNQASAHLENKETNSAAENGIMSPPTGERGVVSGPAAGVSEAYVRGTSSKMQIKIDDAIVGEVNIVKDATTQMVASVIAPELVAALCEVTPKQASSALQYALTSNPSLQQVHIATGHM